MMNEFGNGSLLRRISAKTCLKMDYFGSNSPKIAKCWGLRSQTPLPLAAGSFAPQTPVQVKWLENVQDLTPIEITGWCRCLANLKAKLNLYFIFSAPFLLSLVQKTFPCHCSSLCFIKFLIKLSHRIISYV